MVDMNILYDYMPEQFLDNIPLFLDQVKRVEFIDEFLSRLRQVYYPSISLHGPIYLTPSHFIIETKT